jgi:hypothetical protein
LLVHGFPPLLLLIVSFLLGISIILSLQRARTSIDREQQPDHLYLHRKETHSYLGWIICAWFAEQKIDNDATKMSAVPPQQSYLILRAFYLSRLVAVRAMERHDHPRQECCARMDEITGNGHGFHGCDSAVPNTTINNKMNKAKTTIAAFLAGLKGELVS